MVGLLGNEFGVKRDGDSIPVFVGGMIGKRNLTNGEILDLLEDVESYLRLNTQLSEKLARGRFSLVTSRKYQVVPMALNRVEEACLRVDWDDSSRSFRSVTTLCSSDSDPMLLLSPLPSPALRKSKEVFSDLFRDVLSLSSLVVRLQGAITRSDAPEEDNLEEPIAIEDPFPAEERAVSPPEETKC